MKKVILQRGIEQKIKAGYLWIQRNWIDNFKEVEGEELIFAPVYSHSGSFLGMAYINPSSFITARIYSRKEEALTKELIKEKLTQALNYRKKLSINSNAYKLFFSESDGLPGLIVDYYNGVVVFQILTKGLEAHRNEVVKAIEEVICPEAIVERRDAPGRILEGLETSDPVIHRGAEFIENGKILIEEHGIKFEVDLFKGHKTGHYLDQRENRLTVAKLAKNKSVLDCFCNTGGFGIYCAVHGAKEIMGIDISEHMLKLAARNAELNNVEKICTFVKGNVFDELRNLKKRGKKFDMIILDPPSFTKSRKTLKNALKGYKDINVKAMKLLNRGGILVTASCSHHVTLDIFMEVIKDALKDARRRARIMEIRYQAPDHPIIPEMPETLYLKLLILEIY